MFTSCYHWLPLLCSGVLFDDSNFELLTKSVVASHSKKTGNSTNDVGVRFVALLDSVSHTVKYALFKVLITTGCKALLNPTEHFPLPQISIVLISLIWFGSVRFGSEKRREEKKRKEKRIGCERRETKRRHGDGSYGIQWWDSILRRCVYEGMLPAIQVRTIYTQPIVAWWHHWALLHGAIHSIRS